MSRHPMDQYHDLMRRCLDEGEPVRNVRTGQVCYTLIGEQLKFDLREGFPAITTRKLAFCSALGELLGILRGSESAATFRSLGCGVWDANANENPTWLANPARRGTDDLGKTYGSHWCDLTGTRIVYTRKDLDHLEGLGWETAIVGTGVRGWHAVMQCHIHQVEECVRKIMTDPSDRRIIIDGWRPDEHDRSSLAACHLVYSFAPNVRTRRLDMVMHQRSWDTFLAFNIPMCALLLHIMARLTDYEPGIVTMQITNAHVYASHEQQVRLQLSREHYEQPTLWINPQVTPLTSIEDIRGVFMRLQPEDFSLQGYRHHRPIKAPMAI